MATRSRKQARVKAFRLKQEAGYQRRLKAQEEDVRSAVNEKHSSSLPNRKPKEKLTSDAVPFGTKGGQRLEEITGSTQRALPVGSSGNARRADIQFQTAMI